MDGRLVLSLSLLALSSSFLIFSINSLDLPSFILSIALSIVIKNGVLVDLIFLNAVIIINKNTRKRMIRGIQMRGSLILLFVALIPQLTKLIIKPFIFNNNTILF